MFISRCLPSPTATSLASSSTLRWQSYGIPKLRIAKCAVTGQRTKLTAQHRARFTRNFTSTRTSRDNGTPVDNKLAGVSPVAVTWFTPEPLGVVSIIPTRKAPSGRKFRLTDIPFSAPLQSPADILPHIPILPRASDTRDHVPILLLTPSFAHWARSSSSFLAESMSRIFRNSRSENPGSSREVYSVVTVVDGLPLPDGVRSNSSNNVSGGEGISLLFVNRKDIGVELIKEKGRKDISTPELEPTLSYLVPQPADDAEHGGNKFAEVSIRVANTLFLNSKPRTMVATRWEPSPDSDTMVRKDKFDLINCLVKSTTKPKRILPRIPLSPVTERKEVITSMGNIISQVSKSPGSATGVPASAELEKTLPEYIKKHSSQNQRLAVWALIQPASSSHTKTSSMPESANPQLDDVSLAITRGARLHRVVSGGGGWGKKQGLLSLDPEYSIFQPEHSSGKIHLIDEIFAEQDVPAATSEHFATDTDTLPDFPDFITSLDGQLVTPLSEIATKGDSIQFFVAPLDGSHSSLLATSSPTNPSESSSNHIQCSWGVISSPDTSPSYLPQSPTPSSPGDTADAKPSEKIITVHDHFGALSEKGMIYTTFSTDSSSRGSWDATRQSLAGTKINVPGSSIVMES
ncbi:hypothetical protein AJ80_09709 [Polytolypa hystricis UAMH7299]|uniref:Uncharacterized protein n=1 Tax=Polytolypa hystricis (strain UAMH7299) TaxID=1447883 RepID=A0A2B7WLG9_POLH7|nr:hypothetical protein AJ80_09709 [Polytolypa hystricis UAMH7299]